MRRLKTENINEVLFMDIETVPQWEKLTDAPENVQKEWIYKFKFAPEAPQVPDPEKNVNSDQEYFHDKYMQWFVDLWEKKAALHAEFAKIVCISAGYLDSGTFRLKSYRDENEGDLLNRFADDLNTFTRAVKLARMCAHYGKGFDYPFTAKRMIINRIHLPILLDNYSLKPWEIVSLDTHEMWKIGSFSGSSGMSALCMALGITTPKDDIDGSDVSRVYYSGDLDRVVEYCEKDVIALLRCFQVMRGEEITRDENIQLVI